MELVQTKRQIDKQEDYTMPRLARQLNKIDCDMSDLEAKRSIMATG